MIGIQHRVCLELIGHGWASGTTPDDEAKLLAEEMIQEHYEGEIRYHQEILDEFKRGEKE